MAAGPTALQLSSARRLVSTAAVSAAATMFGLTYAVIFVWGGAFVGIYTVMLAMVGARFKGGELAGVYRAMGFAWGGGALLGPSTAGVAMRVSPLYGLPGLVAILCGAFALFMLVSRRET